MHWLVHRKGRGALYSECPLCRVLSTSCMCIQMQYLQSLSLAHNKLVSTTGIAHPLLETLNLSCEYHVTVM